LAKFLRAQKNGECEFRRTSTRTKRGRTQVPRNFDRRKWKAHAIRDGVRLPPAFSFFPLRFAHLSLNLRQPVPSAVGKGAMHLRLALEFFVQLALTPFRAAVAKESTDESEQIEEHGLISAWIDSSRCTNRSQVSAGPSLQKV